jgi:hypothetical protein
MRYEVILEKDYGEKTMYYVAGAAAGLSHRKND